MEHPVFNFEILDHQHAPFNHRYLEKIEQTLFYAQEEHPRTLAIRVDLHLSPSWLMDDTVKCHPNLSPDLLSRFICSLKAQIWYYRKSSEREMKRAHPCTLRYFWVREIDTAALPHYHFVLFVNKDLFRGLGNIKTSDTNLGNMIRQAWLSALDLNGYDEYHSLVHFPSKGVYILDRNQPEFVETWNALVFRLSYLAKENTKVYSPRERSMGCSQK
ncbi:TPA: inovirus Gp2 family protein [Kluyvera georgiana]|nr:inovirus Gp2 family protein [Kluyvera georgiana]